MEKFSAGHYSMKKHRIFTKEITKEILFSDTINNEDLKWFIYIRILKKKIFFGETKFKQKLNKNYFVKKTNALIKKTKRKGT